TRCGPPPRTHPLTPPSRRGPALQPAEGRPARVSARGPWCRRKGSRPSAGGDDVPKHEGRQVLTRLLRASVDPVEVLRRDAQGDRAVSRAVDLLARRLLADPLFL